MELSNLSFANLKHFFFFFPSLQLSSSEVDHSIDLTLGNFSDAASLFTNSDTKQFIGITTHPTTPIATRQMPPLAYPQPKQSSSAFNSNGVTSQSSVINSCRTYNNNINNNNNTNSNGAAINNVNNYQQKSSSSSSSLLLAPPPPSRASSIAASSNNNTFVRPSDNKPLINGSRSGYATASQLNKLEVII